MTREKERRRGKEVFYKWLILQKIMVLPLDSIYSLKRWFLFFRVEKKKKLSPLVNFLLGHKIIRVAHYSTECGVREKEREKINSLSNQNSIWLQLAFWTNVSSKVSSVQIKPQFIQKREIRNVSKWHIFGKTCVKMLQRKVTCDKVT